MSKDFVLFGVRRESPLLFNQSKAAIHAALQIKQDSDWINENH